jgi:hypothetical protein
MNARTRQWFRIPAIRPQRFLLFIAAILLCAAPPSESTLAKSYPIIAYGTRTFVAETTETGGTVLVRVYRRLGSTTWERYGGFTIPAEKFAARRAEVKRNPAAGNGVERVYFTGKVIGSTPFQPSSPLYRPPRFRRK